MAEVRREEMTWARTRPEPRVASGFLPLLETKANSCPLCAAHG